MNRSRDETLAAIGLSELPVVSGNIRRVQSLLAERKDATLLEACDVDGSTPLMAAVLTGRLAIFRLLLQSGASPQAKDRRGRSALDYCRASQFIKKLDRYKSLGLLSSLSRQHRCQHHRRARIGKILRHPVALESCRRGGAHEFGHTTLLKYGQKVKSAETGHAVRDRNKAETTFGFIASATNPKVRIGATSGWMANPKRDPNVLDNGKYIHLVHKFGRLLEFTLISSYRDKNGQALPEDIGRFVACHAEKKLGVFWIIAALKAVLGTTDYTRMGDLRNAAVPEQWKRAWILLDHKPCDNVSPAHVFQAM
ncbi:hypothetical protein N657DRAFT_572866 [Parathielavia appendiculata]|uniref:Single-strand DNA deaminase toxin A-like C-terminal domain-containing protein n=1 Tax=Parathielavia appendiculata TaxID=2587402 RepID=A0AAN6Z408_9PEZI|nr:hypothetical protein N657DRAFT_572866 [Parathielavia appendiculata]